MSLDSVGSAFSNLYALIQYDVATLHVHEADAKHPAHLTPVSPRSSSKEEEISRLSSIQKVVRDSISYLNLSDEGAAALSSIKERIAPILEMWGMSSSLKDVDSPRAASGGGSSSSPISTGSDPTALCSEMPGLILSFPQLEPFLDGPDLYSLSRTCSSLKISLGIQKTHSGAKELSNSLRLLLEHFTRIVTTSCESSCLNISRLIPKPVMESILETFFRFPENRYNRSSKQALVSRLHPELLIEYYIRHKESFLPFQKQELITALFTETDLNPGELISLCKEHNFLLKSPEASAYLKRSIKPHITFLYKGSVPLEGAPPLKAHWEVTLDTGALFGSKNTLWSGPTALEKTDDGIPLIPSFLTAPILDVIREFLNKPRIGKFPLIIILKPTRDCPFPGYISTYPGFTFPLAKALMKELSAYPLFIEHAGSLPPSVFTEGTELAKTHFLS